MSDQRETISLNTPEEFFGLLPTNGLIRFQWMSPISFGGIGYMRMPFEATNLTKGPKLVAPGEWAVEGVIGPGALLIVVDKDTHHPDILADYCFLGSSGLDTRSLRKIPKLFSHEVAIFILGGAPHDGIDTMGQRKRLMNKMQGQMDDLGLHADLHAFWNPVRNSWMDVLLYNSNDGFVEARLNLYTFNDGIYNGPVI